MEKERLMTNEPDDDEVQIDLMEVFWKMKSKLWLFLVAMLAGGILFGAYSYFVIQKQYSSTSMIYVDSGDTLSGSISSLTSLQVGAALTKDYGAIIKSRPVLQEVVDNLGLNIDYEQLGRLITLSYPTDTRIIKITVTTSDPEVAKSIVNELTEDSIWRIQEIITAATAVVVEDGITDPQKVSPSNTRNALIGILLGFLIVAVYCVLSTVLNDTIKGSEDVERYLKLPVLCEIPLEQQRRRKRAKTKGGE